MNIYQTKKALENGLVVSHKYFLPNSYVFINDENLYKLKTYHTYKPNDFWLSKDCLLTDNWYIDFEQTAIKIYKSTRCVFAENEKEIFKILNYLDETDFKKLELSYNLLPYEDIAYCNFKDLIKFELPEIMFRQIQHKFL